MQLPTSVWTLPARMEPLVRVGMVTSSVGVWKALLAGPAILKVGEFFCMRKG